MIPEKVRALSLQPGTSVLPLLRPACPPGWPKVVPLLTADMACVGFVAEQKLLDYTRIGRVRILKIKGTDPGKALGSLATELGQRGVLDGPSDPLTIFAAAATLRIPQSLCERIGAKTGRVVLIGFVGRERNCQVWMGRRAATAMISPGKLQPLISASVDVLSVTRERIAEMAYKMIGLQPDLYSRLRSAGITTTMVSGERGIRRISTHAYELDLTDYPSFVPRASQAVEAFEAMSVGTALDSCHAGMLSSPDVVAIIGFCLRHGIITPETDENFDAVNKALAFDIAEPFPFKEEGILFSSL